jgi:glycerate kinase
MKILVASDKFKGSLSAVEACAAITKGLREALPDPRHEIRSIPIADGGDGIAETLLAAAGGKWIETEVLDPLGSPLRAGYALLDGGKTAVIEMAKASGLVLLGGRKKEPLRATTYGTGQLIQHAIAAGADEIILGIGGSATNDGGTGLAEALGYRFEDAEGTPITRLPLGLERIARIFPPDKTTFPRVTVACDVTNPLLGPDGCTRIYGPQKGIAPEDIPKHEERLARLVKVTEAGPSAAQPGAGAAGGLGFGALVFLKADLVRGFDLVAERLGLPAAVAEADLVITGEGSLDAQSLEGKGPHGVVRLASARGKTTVAFCGRLEDRSLEDEFGPIVEIRDPRLSLEENMARGGELLRQAARRFMTERIAAES